MTPKKQNKTKKKGNRKNAVWFIVIFIIIVTASLFLGYYFSNRTEKKPAVSSEELKSNANPEKNVVKISLQGTWVSKYDGAIMEIKGKSFTLEFPSVNKGEIIKGSVSIQKDTVTFIYRSGSQSCNGFVGKYRYTIKKGELILKLISDTCKSRAERNTAPWEAV